MVFQGSPADDDFFEARSVQLEHDRGSAEDENASIRFIPAVDRMACQLSISDRTIVRFYYRDKHITIDLVRSVCGSTFLTSRQVQDYLTLFGTIKGLVT